MIQGADVFIGVSKGNLIDRHDVARMASDPFIFALANPEPEILPEEALAGGASVVATGRSTFLIRLIMLSFPGIFRGALDAKAKMIAPAMKIGAAYALAYAVVEPRADRFYLSL